MMNTTPQSNLKWGHECQFHHQCPTEATTLAVIPPHLFPLDLHRPNHHRQWPQRLYGGRSKIAYGNYFQNLAVMISKTQQHIQNVFQLWIYSFLLFWYTYDDYFWES